MFQKTILVTGSAGFVGSDLVPKLKSMGHKVIGIDLIRENQSDLFVQHDLTKPLNIKNLKWDLCIHLASDVGGIIHNTNKAKLVEANRAIDNTVRLACLQAGCNHIIFMSSINVFEVSQTYQHGPLEINNQKSLYAISKATSEEYWIKQLQHTFIIRPTNIFGKNQYGRHEVYGESHVIPDLLKKIDKEKELEVFGNGSQVRNFIHVSDVNKFIMKNLDFQNRNYFNIRSEITITIGQLAEELIKISGREIKIVFNPDYLKYELFKIKNFDLGPPINLGFNPEVKSIAKGLLF